MLKYQVDIEKDELILSSGGMKGLFSFGVLQTINTMYPLTKFKYVTGSSFGAILAMFVAIDATIKEMEEILLKIDYAEYMDIKIMNLIENKGFIDVYKLGNLFRAVISFKNLDPNITFMQFYELTSKKLTICVTNLTLGRTEYHNYLTTPNISIVQSLLMSLSIPIVFQPIHYQNMMYVDGGVLDHYPYYYHTNTRKIGVCILDDDLFEPVPPTESEEVSLMDYMKKTLDLLWKENIKMKLKNKKPKDTIYIIDNQTNSVEFNGGVAMKKKMVERGIEIGMKYMKKEYRKRRSRYLCKKYIYLWLTNVKKRKSLLLGL